MVFGRRYTIDMRHCDRRHIAESLRKAHLKRGCDWSGGGVDIGCLRFWRFRQLMTSHETAIAGSQVDCAASEVVKRTKTRGKDAIIRVVNG